MITLQHEFQTHIIHAMENDKEVGNIEYNLSNNTMTITHTRAFVEGKGIGRLLAVAAIEYANNNGMRIIPQCSYVKALMHKTEEYQKLVAK